MKIYKLIQGILLQNKKGYFLLENQDWDVFVNRDDLFYWLQEVNSKAQPVDNPETLLKKDLLAPIQSQEVWAAGVTYYRSRTARMEESEAAGGGDFYDRVYEAERPELFFKATAGRTVSTGGKVRIRGDSAWNVPEPELTLFITSNARIVGYTIGNDMSSRSIEGENPLYLPQAKTYDGSAGLGPCIYVPEDPLPRETRIQMEVFRDRKNIFENAVSLNQMKRSQEELVDYLFRECSFPQGCFLMTGTGIVPPNEFTLHRGDEIRITIDPIGTLINFVD